MIITTEHQKIEPNELEGLNLDMLRRRINYDTSKFMPSEVNLLQYDFDRNKKCDIFSSYFRIGAEWLDTDQTLPFIVVPKIKNIDFIEMFMSCLQNNKDEDNFAAIYDIDFNAKPIHSKTLSAILSPLLVVQFLMVVKKISIRGLRKDYVTYRQDLPKVKGRLNIRATEHNSMLGHRELMNCTFDEFSVDTPENRYIKKALMVAHDMISMMRDHKSYASLSAMCNHCLSGFTMVSDTVSTQVPVSKSNNLYHEYNSALRYAGMILRHRDIAVSNRNHHEMDIVPVFRIDMALLFEHYTLSLLRRVFGKNHVKYQEKGYHGRFIADFLITKGNQKVIADAKYSELGLNNSSIPQYIKQLSAYARDKTLLKAMDIDTLDEDKVPIIPCVILYPDTNAPELTNKKINLHSIKQSLRLYTFPIQIPTY